MPLKILNIYMDNQLNKNDMTKEKILTIVNIYQNYFNDFKNVSEDDLHRIYIMYTQSEVSIKEIREEVNKLIKKL